MEVPGREALVAERVQQRRVPAGEHVGDLPADGDHLVAVVRVRGHEHVRAHVVEDGEVVRGERADAAGADLAVARAAALEALQAVRERGAPEVGEAGLDRAGGVGVDLELVALRQRLGAALDALAVGLEVDAPLLVGHQRAVVGVQRRVGVDVQHRGRLPSAVTNTLGSTSISPSWRYQ